MHPKVAKARSAAGVAARNGDPTRILDARRDLAAAKLEDYVAKVVDSAPPLTTEQRERIAALLRPTLGGDAA